MVPVSPDVVVALSEEVSAPMLSEVSLAQPVLCQSVTSTPSRELVALPESSELEASLVLPELAVSPVSLDPQVPPVSLELEASLVLPELAVSPVSLDQVPLWVSLDQVPQWV
jgi:hypothetical protein